MEEIFEYDSNGRLKYHPKLHGKTGKPWTEDDLEYLCKYHAVDDIGSIALALDRTHATVASKLTDLRKNGKYDYYRSLNCQI